MSVDELAIHEAGHAVVAEAFGYRVTEVSVGAKVGHCLYYVPGEDAHPEPGGMNMQRRLAVKAAGTVAELLFFGRDAADVESWTDVVLSLLGQDGREARELLGASPRSRKVPELREAICWAAEILTDRWPNVLERAQTVHTSVHTTKEKNAH